MGAGTEVSAVSTKVALFIGSLRRDSLNRKLAKALQMLGPKGWQYEEIRFDALPFYKQDEAKPMPDSVRELKKSYRIVRCRYLRHAGVQPLGAGGVEERHRLGV